MASIGIIGLLLLLTLIVPQFLHGDPLALTDDILQPPSARHWLGTDDLGRDVLVEIIYGTRVSFLIGCTAALATAVAGTAIGSLGGFFGGVADTVVTRLAEFFQVMPTFILAVVIVALAGPGLLRVVAVIALVLAADRASGAGRCCVCHAWTLLMPCVASGSPSGAF